MDPAKAPTLEEVMARPKVPGETRAPLFIWLDEIQPFLLAEMEAQAAATQQTMTAIHAPAALPHGSLPPVAPNWIVWRREAHEIVSARIGRDAAAKLDAIYAGTSDVGGLFTTN